MPSIPTRKDLRGIVGVLGDADADLHPQPGLSEVLELIDHNRSSGLRIRVANGLDPGLTLSPATGAAVHRIVQEGLTNVHKHAPGAAVELRLQPLGRGDDDRDRIQVELVNRSSARPGQERGGELGAGIGRGLPGLRERVRARGGSLEAGPTDEGGWRLAATLPMGGPG